MSSGHGDCRKSSERIVLEYSPHGRKSTPNECSISTRLVSAATAPGGPKRLKVAKIQMATNRSFHHLYSAVSSAKMRSRHPAPGRNVSSMSKA